MDGLTYVVWMAKIPSSAERKQKTKQNRRIAEPTPDVFIEYDSGVRSFLKDPLRYYFASMPGVFSAIRSKGER